LNDFPNALGGGAVTIGNFDGVHLGHARLVERLQVMARNIGGPAVVLTFDPHPAWILHPEAAPQPLVWNERKVEILAELGVDAVVIHAVDVPFLEMESREFFDRIVLGRLGAKALVEGANFFFGHNRSGTIDVLRQFCTAASVRLEVPPPVNVDGQVVSSSRIRSAIVRGGVDEARRMLGRPYRVRGTVVRGAGRGAKLGYPTANLNQIDTLLPPVGIYAGRAWVDSTAHPAAICLGPNPTFDESILKVEVYLMDFHGDLYDRPLQVDFLARLRDIKKFASVEELIDQMAQDVAQSRLIAAQE
jgi:riboflavin kinase/FMN adenylyltransferase